MTSVAIGLFSAPQSALSAAEKLNSAGFTTAELLSPIPLEGVEAALGEKPNTIKRFTLFGGLFGACFGFILAAGTAVLYLHPTGGRPIITLPPFFIIAYEMTILFGILATVLGFFISARLPALKERVYVPEVGVDKFALTVRCKNAPELSRVQTLMREAGAETVRTDEETS